MLNAEKTRPRSDGLVGGAEYSLSVMQLRCEDRLLLENNDGGSPAGNILPRSREKLSICDSPSVITKKNTCAVADLTTKIREMVNAAAMKIHFIPLILFRGNCFDLLIAINIARGKKSFPWQVESEEEARRNNRR